MCSFSLPTSERRHERKQVSPRLEKYFRVGGPSLPASWPAPLRSPRSSGPRSPDTGCARSFYRLQGREGNHTQRGPGQAAKESAKDRHHADRGIAWAEQHCCLLIKLNETLITTPGIFVYFCFVQKQKAWRPEE